jgi:hypothetical protein
MADRDIETVVDGMERTGTRTYAMLERRMNGGAHLCRRRHSAPLPCGCDPATDYKCPEHRTEPA